MGEDGREGGIRATPSPFTLILLKQSSVMLVTRFAMLLSEISLSRSAEQREKPGEEIMNMRGGGL